MAAVIFHSEKYTAAHMVYCVAFDISLCAVFSAVQCFCVTRQWIVGLAGCAGTL